MNRLRNNRAIIIAIIALVVAAASLAINIVRMQTPDDKDTSAPSVLWTCSPAAGLPQSRADQPFAYVVCDNQIAVIRRGEIFRCTGSMTTGLDECDMFSERAAAQLHLFGAEEVEFAHGELLITVPGMEPVAESTVYLIDRSLRSLLALTAAAD